MWCSSKITTVWDVLDKIVFKGYRNNLIIHRLFNFTVNLSALMSNTLAYFDFWVKIVGQQKLECLSIGRKAYVD
jgi:hypothetical protein